MMFRLIASASAAALVALSLSSCSLAGPSCNTSGFTFGKSVTYQGETLRQGYVDKVGATNLSTTESIGSPQLSVYDVTAARSLRGVPYRPDGWTDGAQLPLHHQIRLDVSVALSSGQMLTCPTLYVTP